MHCTAGRERESRERGKAWPRFSGHTRNCNCICEFFAPQLFPPAAAETAGQEHVRYMPFDSYICTFGAKAQKAHHKIRAGHSTTVQTVLTAGSVRVLSFSLTHTLCVRQQKRPQQHAIWLIIARNARIIIAMAAAERKF